MSAFQIAEFDELVIEETRVAVRDQEVAFARINRRVRNESADSRAGGKDA